MSIAVIIIQTNIKL